MIPLLVDIGLSIIIVLAFGALLRQLARWEFYWVIVPANTYAIIVTEDSETGGGSIVNLLHGVDGHIIAKSDADSMNWEFVPDKEEPRDLLFRLLGIQRKGLYWQVRENTIHRFRYKPNDVRKENILVKYVHYTGDERVTVEEVETAGNFRLNFEFNLIYRRLFPVRSILRVSDSNAYLTTMIQELVIQVVGKEAPEKYLAGAGSDIAKAELVKIVRKKISRSALKHPGIFIQEVNFHAVGADKTTVKYLEQVEKARRDAEVIVIAAQAAKDAKMLDNDAEADKVDRVILPVAKTPGGPAVRAAEAYENNSHVTTFAPGGNGLGLILDPRSPEKKTKDPVGFKPDSDGKSTATE